MEKQNSINEEIIKDCCPPDMDKKDCGRCDKLSVEFGSAVNKSEGLVLSGVIGGLALAIALILQQPIASLIAYFGQSDPTIISLITIAIYFLIAVLLVFVLNAVNRQGNKYKKIAEYNKYTI